MALWAPSRIQFTPGASGSVHRDPGVASRRPRSTVTPMSDTTIPCMALDLSGLATALSMDIDILTRLVADSAWNRGLLPRPVEIRLGDDETLHLWSVAAVTRWLTPEEPVLSPRLVDYRGLARLLGFSTTKVRHLAVERAWEDGRLPWPMFDEARSQRMWALTEVDDWIARLTTEARGWTG